MLIVSLTSSDLQERKEHEEGVKRAADEKQRAEKKRADEERKRWAPAHAI